MSTQAFLPFQDKGTDLVTKGDIIELVTGEELIFIEMKRTKWIGQTKDGKKRFNVPIYRDKIRQKPYAKTKKGRDESVITKSVDINKFKPGNLFSIESAKESFMFKNIEDKRGKISVIAIDIATGNQWKLGAECTFKRININELKNKLNEY